MIEKDFGDWLSPMLVKEIRQGFRSRIFMLAFLLIQGFMIFCVVLGLSLSVGDFTDQSSFFFWLIICVPILLIMPSHGFAVLGSEIKDNTMELLFLTRLSAWRIVVGKWTAIIAQTVLIVCSVLPYMVLRYFMGGINLLDDLKVLGWLLYASAMLTGLTIAISPFYRSILSKMLLPVATVILIVVVFSSLGPMLAMAGGMYFTHSFLIAVVLGPLFLLLMFEIAVSRIAPSAENHSFRKRLLGFLILGAIAFLDNVTAANTIILMFIGAILLIPVCVTGLCEEVKLIPSIYLPFVKRGAIGRLAGLIFYPGWPSGMLFTLVAIAAYLAIFFSRKHWFDSHAALMTISMAGALLMPLAVEKMFFQRFKKTFVIYFSFQVFMGTAALIASALKDEGWAGLVSPLPTSVFLLALFRDIDPGDELLFIRVGAVVVLGSLVVLLLKWVVARRQVAQMEEIAREMLMKPAEPEIANATAA